MPLDFAKNLYDNITQRVLQYKTGIRWLLAITVSIVVIVLYQLDVFGRLELLTLDARFVMRQPKASVSDIVFIDMAEDSITAIGRWPWPRKWHAALVNILTEYKPRVIAFDVIFSEPQDPADDTAFEEAIKLSGEVYLPLLYDLKSHDANYFYKGEGVTSIIEPIPAFKQWIKGTGHINAMPDMDGILRRIPPVINYNGKDNYQFGLKIGLDSLGLKEGDLSFDPLKHSLSVKAKGGKFIRIPLDRNNQMIINWQGRWGKDFKHFSYVDVIKSYALLKEGKKPIVDLNEFKDKICIIGLTASGLIDIKPIPIENAYPAVGVNATVINNVMRNDFIREPSRRFNVILIFLISIVITWYLSNLRFLGGMLAAGVSVLLYAIISFAIFNLYNIALLTFYPALAIVLSYSLTSLYTQILQSVERARLFKQATRDGLTYLYNIRHFNLLLEAEFKNVSMYKFRKLSLIMADIDNFKHINDTYGHQAGDIVLREVARVIQAKCRQIDVVARYGGEEFIVMLSGAGEKDAADVAEKIRLAVEERKFRFRNETYRATISVGVTEFSNERNKDELIEKADKALYRAKHAGKNQVCLYSVESHQIECENPPPPKTLI